MEYKTPYAGAGAANLANPHRPAEAVEDWAQQAASEVLSFTPQNQAERLEDFKKYFVQQGWQQYADALKAQKLLDAVTVEGYSMGTIVTTPPEVTAQDANGGAYHWVVKMPLNISFYSRNAAGQVRPGKTYPFTLLLNVTRTGAGMENGLAIAGWQMKKAGE